MLSDALFQGVAGNGLREAGCGRRVAATNEVFICTYWRIIAVDETHAQPVVVPPATCARLLNSVGLFQQ